MHTRGLLSRVGIATVGVACLGAGAGASVAADDYAVAPQGSLACPSGENPDGCLFFHFGASSDADGGGAGGSVHVSHALLSHAFQYDGRVTCMEVVGNRAVIGGETDLLLGGGVRHIRGFRLTAVDGGGPGSGLDTFTDETFDDPVTDCSQQSSYPGFAVERGDIAVANAPVFPNVRPVAASSPNDSTHLKTTTVACPAGTRVLGAWGTSTFGEQAILDDTIPNGTLTAVTARAVENETGTDAAWSLVANAYCADPLPGLQRISVTSQLDSSPVKSAFASCTGGTRVVGTGAAINAGKGEVVLDDVHPSADLTRVEVKAVEDETGLDGPWSVTAVAVCADPPGGLERFQATSSLQSNPSTTAGIPVSACPSLLGLGSLINAGQGQVRRGFTFRAGRPPSEYYGIEAVEDENGFDGLWSVTAILICADV